MKCLLTNFLILYLFCVFPRAGGPMDKQLTVISPSDDNGDASKTIVDFANDYNLSFEEHVVTTEDGYTLTLWRLYKSTTDYATNPPLLIQHGILDSGYSFFYAGKRNSIVYYLANRGHDIWIGNSRGQIRSLKNEPSYWWYNPFSKYWDFSFHEMALYDFPAAVQYMKKVTGHDKINFIGHSQGATQYFVKGSFDPDFINNNINAFIAIGPAVFISKHNSIVANALAYKYKVVDWMYFAGAKSFVVVPDMILNTLETFCRTFPEIYYGIVPNIGGYTKKDRFDIRRWPSLCAKNPCGASTKTLLHWMQIFRADGKFQMFDYGAEKNMEIYGQETPKDYPVERLKEVNVPTLILSGTSDALISQESIWKLVRILKNDKEDQILDVQQIEDYSHVDFIWGIDSVKDVYPHIDRFFKRVLKLRS